MRSKVVWRGVSSAASINAPVVVRSCSPFEAVALTRGEAIGEGVIDDDDGFQHNGELSG